MKVTITYHCDGCGVSFPAYCGVPDALANGAAGHGCGGDSAFSGCDGTTISYMCEKCGHTTRADVTDMIPAMASRRHGCGRGCSPA